MGEKTIKKTEYPSEGVVAEQEISTWDGEQLDTLVKLSGQFVVSGSERTEFINKLGALIDQYRI
ncbi:hypothetical protein SBX64_15855 [Vibrio rhizosphaerae]|uniref:Uncharacterized protein n=1 Tax=Vibrio rhizosphaerae TaxID=398736 RepID=A0ABU4IYL7_9VIBR|nr:hypothetical protein [Vibrio rhizosphaerae]MDW6094013.1 hypothetical protein [Vibrio rhizosphaerae]